MYMYIYIYIQIYCSCKNLTGAEAKKASRIWVCRDLELSLRFQARCFPRGKSSF